MHCSPTLLQTYTICATKHNTYKPYLFENIIFHYYVYSWSEIEPKNALSWLFVVLSESDLVHLSVGRCYRTLLFRKRSRFSDIVHCYFKNASESSCFIAYDSCKWSFHMNFILWFISFAMGLVYTGVIHIKQTYILLIEPTLYDSRGYRRTLAVTYVHVRLMG